MTALDLRLPEWTRERLTAQSIIRDLPLHEGRIEPHLPGREVKALLEARPELPGVLILRDGHGPALVSRKCFHEILSLPFRLELFMNRPISYMVENGLPAPLILPETERINTAVEAAFARTDGEMYEPILVEGAGGEMRLLDMQALLLSLSRVLSLQNDELQRTQSELTAAMTTLEQTNRQLLESIEYASLIQRAFLPSREEIARAVSDFFIVWEPRDLVGGDCYWLKTWPEGALLAVIDCTGHGVPGAFMTLIVSSLLDRFLENQTSHRPDELLGRMNRAIKTVLHKDDRNAADDGMEAALCYLDRVDGRIRYAGAGISLLALPGPDGTEEERIRADRAGVGYRRTPADQVYTLHESPLRPEATYYLLTDGVTDLVGGPKRLTLGRRRLSEILRAHHELPLDAQRERLLADLGEWQGEEPVRDDMTLIGFRP